MVINSTFRETSVNFQLAISKRGGPPSRIPLPTNHSHLGLMGPLSTNADSGPPQKYLKGNLRHTRSGPAGFSSMGSVSGQLGHMLHAMLLFRVYS